MPNIRHGFVSPKTDGADSTLLRPSYWNANLQYTNSVGAPSGSDASIRRILTNNENFYVRTDGNDGNDGSADDAAHAFLTMQAAAEYIRDNIDPAGNIATVKVADGTYTTGVNIVVGMPDWSYFRFEGNVVTPGNVIVSTTNDYCFAATQMTKMWVTGFKIQSSGAGGIRANDTSFVVNGNNEFGACLFYHMVAQPFSAIYLNEDYTVTGGATAHLAAFQGASIEAAAVTITITGTPAFNDFISIGMGGSANVSGPITIVGTTTGRRYRLANLGSIETGSGASATFFPGNLNGVAEPGSYDKVFYTTGFSKTALPPAVSVGGIIYVSDEVGGAVLAFSDGTNWRRVTDRAIVS